MTAATSGCRWSTAIVTALTSWTKRAPIGSRSGPEPDPVMNIADAFAGNVGELVADRDEQLEHLLGLPRLVALIVGPENLFRVADRRRRP